MFRWPHKKEHTYYNTISDKLPPRSGIVDMNAHKKGYVNDEFIKEHLKEKEKSPSQVRQIMFDYFNPFAHKIVIMNNFLWSLSVIILK